MEATGHSVVTKQVSRSDYKVTAQIIEKSEKLIQNESGGLKKVSVVHQLTCT